ncbi:phosphoribosylanthranilate isomerase [Thermocrinis sp.]|uniref:phosphoribosylanthranilate isomerase n=1 Tax=Thermocrinis sp. TaxID=2024383 RepID=UPI002FDEDEE4
MSSVKVKFCGITREEDIKKAIELGVDYVGFIMYPKSPRWVGWEKLKNLLRLSEGVKKVVVFVNPSYQEVEKALSMGADLVQLHGEESFEFAKGVGLERVIKAFRVIDNFSVAEDWKGAHAILLDTYSEKAYGGTGESFDWTIAQSVVNMGFRVFLSGGLKKENVQKAIKIVRPYGVDVSSGIESSPGIKDHKKMEEFIHAVKNALKD